VLYHRINTEDYKECQDDIQAVSGIAEDIRGSLLDYQVCYHKPYAAGVQLKWDTLTDGTATGDIRPELQADRESHSACVESVSDVDRGSQDIGSVLRSFLSNPTYPYITQRTYQS
jgi:hypothetical protein